MSFPPVLQESYDPPLYFYTATILNWKKLLSEPVHAHIVIESLEFMAINNRATIFGFVIMPNHIHLILRLDEDYPLKAFRRDFHKFTAQYIIYNLKRNNPDLLLEFTSTQKDRKFQIWERRALAIPIYNETVFWQKLEYMHMNPLQEKWQLAKNPSDYTFSSASSYMTNKAEWNFLTVYQG